jgi:CRP/FNR family transcriptional regulator, cyclic AMP receptor protein
LKRTAADLLDADPDLAEALPAADQERLRGVLRVPVFSVDKGNWDPRRLERGAIGVLVLGGLMMRRHSFGVVASAELLGQGDILRPGDEGPTGAPPHSSAWRVLADVELALIDRRVTALIGRFPELVAAIAGRLLRRSRCLAYLMAAQHLRRADDALLATLWHIAGMWGKVTLGGVVVPFHFTHQELADITGSRRPTVTVALRVLEAQGRLRREDPGRWLLLGDPPAWSAEEIDQTRWTSLDAHRPIARSTRAPVAQAWR